MRRLSLTNKKPRGIPRRLRSLDKWAHQFENWFPADLKPEDRYCNWKIPVFRNLVEGRHASKDVRSECAQRLIDACHRLICAKPREAETYRVTCVVCLPDMFSSEVCIYLKEDYFQSHTSVGHDKYGSTAAVVGRSLAREWGLVLPDGVAELGLALDYREFEDPEDWFVGERWYFGELHPHG